MTDYLRFQFSRQDDLTSDLIALGGAGEFSHVDIVLPNGCLLGARSDHIDGLTGVQIRMPDYAKWARQVFIDVACTASQAAKGYDFALEQVGKGYDKWAIAGFVVGRNWREEDKWFCSELAARTGEVAGVFDEMFSPVNKIEPVELSLVASSQVGRVITVIK